jgi:hypothetical protein
VFDFSCCFAARTSSERVDHVFGNFELVVGFVFVSDNTLRSGLSFGNCGKLHCLQDSRGELNVACDDYICRIDGR